MTRFIYIAKEKKGEATKTIKGFIDSVNEGQAAKILRKKNFIPIKIFPSKESFFKEIFIKFFRKISLSEVTNFTRNLATMITAGLPLTETLNLLKDQASVKMNLILEDVLTCVGEGSSLAEALGKHQDVFPKVYVALVKAGESAGILDVVMKRLADNLEKQREFQSKLKGAMIYPAIIVLGMAAVVLIMMIFVIPKLTGLYKEFGAKLPTPTLILIFLSSFLVVNFPVLIILVVGGFYFLRVIQKTPVGKKKIDGLKLKIPLIGNLQKQAILAEVARTLGLLVGTGVQIVEALNIVADASGNLTFADGIKRAAKQVEKGFPLSQALAENEDFPPIMSQLLSVGEETGKVDEVLEKISHFFETEADQMLKGLTTAIEPLIMILLGVGVGFLIIAIIMPIYSLTSQF